MSMVTEQHAISANDARTRLEWIQDQINSVTDEIGLSTDTVRFVGASKAQPLTTIRAFAQAGIKACGENYLQEAITKLDELKPYDLEWHFIGHIQTNKAKQVAERFTWVQTLDSLRLAKRLSDARLVSHPNEPLNCCIQVNVDDESQKAGVSADSYDELVEIATDLPGIRLRGVMAIPKPYPDLTQRIASFERVKEMFDNAPKPQPQYWDTISMGMSEDYLTAIRCGANLVRLGTVLFGPRPTK
ncbi:MAG: YggS family pyridoxal phosphate-dependent enzyme [Gammaproteobacteria bacterium]|nr:YggS family pyridoxal phosphate-dependent enzyme [Gammaproteobacteria bacterium]